MNKPLQTALSCLPPEITTVVARLGIEPVKIEGSGAMRLRIRNNIAVTQKAAAIAAFKSVLRQYGLDMGRITTETTAQCAWDASILMIKRDEMGRIIPLFDRAGNPMAEKPPSRSETQACGRR